jgi:hypothetical protein
MKSIAMNVLAAVAGVFVGSLANMLLVNIGPFVVPLPEGADVSTMEGVRDSMKLFAPANFLFPFLGHAVGTLVGAFVAAKIAASQPMKFAIGIGVFFLLGGTMMANMVGGPVWFIAADLLLAYLPMGVLGGILANRKPAATA